ncbi:Arginase/deacetylase [Ramicandelaber brevisporus]|nr:Arginase/deacetylase [Ramicandelaber brevisporus]
MNERTKEGKLTQPMTNNKIIYVASKRSIAAADKLPANEGRSTLVHSLVSALGLLQHACVSVVPPPPASARDLCAFHTSEYINHLFTPPPSTSISHNESKSREMGLIDQDTPLFDGLPEYMALVAGGSMLAAHLVATGRARVGIHWDGGRHHAARSKAAGFCYVNDIVLAILTLQRSIPMSVTGNGRQARVLYVDLDAHHGDGVEAAFARSSSVCTVSFHGHGPGWYPPKSGSRKYRGAPGSPGYGYSINVPLRDGLSDQAFAKVVATTVEAVKDRFRPHAVVVQCGCDGLYGDELVKEFNLSTRAIGDVVASTFAKWNLPTVYLGGGGYNHVNAARCWAYITHCIISGTSCSDDAKFTDLPDEIPEHSYLEKYGGAPALMHPPVSQRPDHNLDAIDDSGTLYIDELLSSVLKDINELPQR